MHRWTRQRLGLGGRSAFGVRRAWLGASVLAAALAISACDWGDLDGIPGGFADGVDNDTVVTAGPGLTEAGGMIEVDFDDTDSHSGSSDLVARGDHDHDDDYVLKVGDTMTGALVLPADGLVAGTSQLVLSSGRVGIGTAAPQSELDVNGTITATGLTIPTGAVASHVLTSDASGNAMWAVAAGGPTWGLLGNAGTTAGTNFLGTTDNVALELHVNGTRALRLVPEAGGPSILGGHPENYIEPGAYAATVSGGGATAEVNRVYDSFGTISGGRWNQAGVDDGGTGAQMYGTVGGGYGNYALNIGATVAGGITNFASGKFAAIPGGHENSASGDYSLAAGRRAKADHPGVFVWADSTDAYFASTGADQFLIRASGGVGIGTTSPTEQLSVSGSAEVSTSVKSPVYAPLAGDGTTLTIRTNDAATASGGITIRTGNIPVNGGTTGSITLQTGQETAAFGSGGAQLTLYGYPNFNQGGPVTMRGGDSWANAGAVTIRGGNSGSGKGGDLTLKGGGGGGGLGGGGTVIIDSGAGGSQAPGIVSFRVDGAEKMRVHSDGNVGINTASPGSALHVAGPIATATRTVAADDALTGSDSVLFVDSSGGSRTITLPPASAATVGRVYHVYKADSSGVNTVSVQAAGGDVLNGAATISQPHGCLRVIGSAATEWIGNVTE